MSARFTGFGPILVLCLSLATPSFGQGTDTSAHIERSGTAPSVRIEARPEHMLRYPVAVQTGSTMRPRVRMDALPAARWDDRGDGAALTRSALAALRTEAPGLSDVVPRDITEWCPAYAANPPHLRQAFWVGILSALSHYESGHRPDAVGGGGRWFGLLQISPTTAQSHDCRAQSGADLTDPAANLACAARIVDTAVSRDQAVALFDGRWRGVAADWGPMTSQDKRATMAAWTRQQAYCVSPPEPMQVIRPLARPRGPEPALRMARSEGRGDRTLARN